MHRRTDFTPEKKKIYRWLFSGIALIALMVIIGGITRLTQSGLSMVKWEPIIGAFPPLNEKEWMESFELYKQSPEFIHYNSHFTLDEYKGIYFWEYLHRLIGRIIGLIFLVPCIYFWVKGWFDSHLKKQVIFIFLGGLMQGVVGWAMVKSGLVDKPHVSHYRLAAHLMTALALIIYIYYVALTIKYEIKSASRSKLLQPVNVFFALIVLQIIYGAFVAGLKGGRVYNTFPKMGENWFPPEMGIILKRDGMLSFLESSGWVQLIHRFLAYSIVGMAIFIFLKTRKSGLQLLQRKSFNLVLILILLQVVFGITTLLLAVPVFWGVLHQFTAILVLLAVFHFKITLGGGIK